MGNKAIVLGYMIPFVLLISVLLIMNLLGAREWISGLVSTGCVGSLFYSIIFIAGQIKENIYPYCP